MNVAQAYTIPNSNHIPNGRSPHDRGSDLLAPARRARPLPEDMYRRRQWVAFDAKKRPIDPKNGRAASPTDETTWGMYAEACAMVDAGRAVGIGFVLTANDPYACIDLDKCRDPETGTIELWALKIVDAIGSYTEISPSGTGVHIWMLATMPGERNRTGRVEVYATGRYMTVTERSLPGYASPVRPSQEPFNALYADLFPAKPTEPQPERPAWTGPGMDSETIIRKASTARNNAKFRALYRGDTSDYGSDDSRADAAFVRMLAFWTQDPEQITEIWRSSGLYRAKTDREDYARRTVAKILNTYAGPYYDPTYRSTPTPVAPTKPDPITDTYDEMSREELITTLRERDAELQHERSVRYSIETIAASDTFQAGPRLTAIGEVLHIADQQRRGIKPTEHGYLSTAPQIAKRTGQAPKTASKHLKLLDDKAGIGRSVVSKIADVETVDMDTGEIIRAGQVMQYGYVKADNVIDLAERVASYERTPEDPKHGGERDVCAKHPDAGTYTEHITKCRECHDVVHETTTKTSGPPIGMVTTPSTHHGDTGSDVSKKHSGGMAPAGPSTQDGHTESVSIYLPKMGIREDDDSDAPLVFPVPVKQAYLFDLPPTGTAGEDHHTQ